MTNILLDGFNIDADWLKPELKNHLKPDMRVAVVAFSFRDSVCRNAADWNALYGKGVGKYYGGIVNAFAEYGITEDDITFVNYFTDTLESAVEKIESADIVYFTGGLPDRMFERIKERGLYDILKNHDKIVMGYSAGAVIQLAEYHLSPDDDYSEFAYYEGLGYLDNFYVEVHYEDTDIQNDAIHRVMAERGKTVYALDCLRGAIIACDGDVKRIGDVKVFGKQ